MATSAPTQPVRQEEIAELILDATLGVHHRVSSDLEAEGLTWTQLDTLCAVAVRGQIDMTSLSRLLDHSTAAATSLVDRLVRSGCVVRTRSREDRRQVYVSPTRKGLSLLRQTSTSAILSLAAPITNPEAELLRALAARLSARD